LKGKIKKILKEENMKNILAIITTLLLFNAQAAELDTSKSKVVWTGKKVTGQHTGEVKIKSGNFKMKDGKLTGGKVVMDMTTITTTDLSGEWAEKLVNHLKADDFFNTSKHKTASFDAKEVTEKKGEFLVKGELTIKDISKPTTVTLKKDGKKYTGKLKFDRTKYGIKYKSGNFFKGLGDKMIYDDVELDLTFVTK
jgi:polyisoprenoid-binding protein YceI